MLLLRNQLIRQILRQVFSSSTIISIMQAMIKVIPSHVIGSHPLERHQEQTLLGSEPPSYRLWFCLVLMINKAYLLLPLS